MYEKQFCEIFSYSTNLLEMDEWIHLYEKKGVEIIWNSEFYAIWVDKRQNNSCMCTNYLWSSRKSKLIS